MTHFDYCNAPICLVDSVNGSQTIWYTDEEICKGHARDRVHRSIRTAQRGYQKRDKAKNISRPLTYGELFLAAESRLTKAAGRKLTGMAAIRKKRASHAVSTKRNPG